MLRWALISLQSAVSSCQLQVVNGLEFEVSVLEIIWDLYFEIWNLNNYDERKHPI